jgi:transcriptional regulator GlxA family with amidase domain
MHRFEVPVPRTELMVIEFMPSLLFALPDSKAEPLQASLPFLRPEIRPDLQKRPADSRRRLLDISRRLIRETGEQQRGWQYFLSLDLWNLLGEVMRVYRGRRPAGARRGVMNDRMQSVMDYVSENISGRISFTEAVRRSCLGPTQFISHFKDIFGQTFSQYVVKCRLAGARNEMLNEKTNLKLEVVARHWGFYDASHLLRAHRQCFGRTPAEDMKKETGLQ